MLKKFAGIVMGAIMTASVCAGAVAVAAVNRPVVQTEGDADPAAVPAAAAEVPTEYAAYLFAHFVGDEANGGKDEQMYFSVSQDGSKWYTLNEAQPVLTSNVGMCEGIRDPSLIRKHDGSGFVILATDLNIYNLQQYINANGIGEGVWSYSQTHGSRNIIIWESVGNSLTEWSEPHAYEIAAPNASCLWAPEAIWDKEQSAYMVFWSSRTQDNGTQKVYRCYTTDFENFTEPEVYIECDESRIDTTIFEENNIYYRFTKNENTKKVYMEKGDSLSGNFKLVSSFRLDGKTYWNEEGTFEGPTMFRLNDNSGYNLLLDNYDYKPYTTTDLDKGVFTKAGDFDFGGVKFRHGSCIPITQDEYNALMEKWGGEAQESEADPIYTLDFDEGNLTAGGTQSTKTATAHGTLTYNEMGYNGTGKAVTFDKDTQSFVSIDGTILAGLDSFTVSFAAKIPDKSTGHDGGKGVNWLFLTEKDDNGAKWRNEHYLSVLWAWQNKEVSAQRFDNENADRPSIPSKVVEDYTFGTWKHITVVYAKTQTRLYIDGELVSRVNSDIDISDLLGSNPKIYLGYATWETNGQYEYSYASMDCFKVYNYALTSAQVQTAYNALNAPAE